MTKPQVVVLDYGSGNVHSAAQALEAAGAIARLTADRAAVSSADGLLVPGVGAFAAVMAQLAAVRADELIDSRLVAGKGVLGICVGMQVMFENGLEHDLDTPGLGQWPGVVDKMVGAPRLPHIGWNTVNAGESSRLFKGVEQERFYFVHSYAAQTWSLPAGRLASPTVTWSEYGSPFIAAVENGPLTATQFHPEKSGPAGIKLLQNWLQTL